MHGKTKIRGEGMLVKKVKSNNLNEMILAYFSDSHSPVSDFVLRERYTADTIQKALEEGYIRMDRRNRELVYYITTAGKEFRDK